MLGDFQTGRISCSGSASCPHGGGGKTIGVVPEVEDHSANAEALRFPISLVGRLLGPIEVNPITESDSARAVLRTRLPVARVRRGHHGALDERVGDGVRRPRGTVRRITEADDR